VLDNGQVNTLWLLESGERRAVLRRLHVSRASAAVEWEVALVRFVCERGWPAPGTLPAGSGTQVLECESRLWTAAEYLPGEHPPEDSTAMQHIYGRLLARLLRDMAAFPLDGQRPGFGKLWELDISVAPADAGSFNDLLRQFGEDYPGLANAVRRYRYRNLRELSRLHYPDLPDYPVHGDFGAENLLWQDGKLSGLLDFDWCCRDALACDLAAAFPWDHMTSDRIRALIEGYEEVRRLDDTEWALLPALTRAHLLSFVAFRLVEWKMLGGTRPAASIERTVRDRLPRTEGLERYLQDLRAGARPLGR
jgi:Ser/Thr protein kinase RdoA (MazF antagonist)